MITLFFLQSTLVLASQLAAIATDVRSSPSPSCPIQNDGCVITDLADNLLAMTQAGSSAECSLMCLDTPNCEYFTYRTDLQDNCALLSSCDQLDDTCDSCWSGAVRCHENCPPGTDHQVNNGVFRCDNLAKSCLVDCDYGFIPRSLHRQPCTTIDHDSCEACCSLRPRRLREAR